MPSHPGTAKKKPAWQMAGLRQIRTTNTPDEHAIAALGDVVGFPE